MYPHCLLFYKYTAAEAIFKLKMKNLRSRPKFMALRWNAAQRH
jgi:hypothetical protein